MPYLQYTTGLKGDIHIEQRAHDKNDFKNSPT